ncbi:serum amyloid A-5 protein-like [Meriones unguiculatus]|uniref:serum amyloid A-5 protein-like n=1 Tax=Meriones unguiculatus TaxID=10047 RepID=UPI00293F1BDE|nr:serum amyloid A-5 protein-like [Meriones unguiculatus]
MTVIEPGATKDCGSTASSSNHYTASLPRRARDAITELCSTLWSRLLKRAGDMWRAYSDMREANWKNSDKYFHARGYYDAAQRGPGGVWAAEVIRYHQLTRPGVGGRAHSPKR